MEYGITREMKPNSFVDAYFGEIGALFKDVRRAPGIKNKILYFFMPPGWSHTGDHKTAAKVRQEYMTSDSPEGSGQDTNAEKSRPSISLASSHNPG